VFSLSLSPCVCVCVCVCVYLLDYIRNTSFSVKLTNGANKLECNITPGYKDLPRTYTLAYWAHS
jgi:hypothetical protein